MSGFPASELPRTAFNVRTFNFSAQSRGFPLQGIGPGSPKPRELHRKRGDSSRWDSGRGKEIPDRRRVERRRSS